MRSLRWASRTLVATALNTSTKVELENILLHKLPVKRLQLADGRTALVTTVYDLTLANYGLERGLNDVNCATSYDDVKAYTPAWAEQITGVSRSQIIRIAREFADNADKTHGRSMIIVGAGAEPLVSPRYELSWSDQHADFLRLCRSERGAGRTM